MLILYAQTQIDGAFTDKNWLDQEIVLIKHRRTHGVDFESSSRTALKKEFTEWAAKACYDVNKLTTAEKKNLGWGFKHYVPYQRIFNCMQEAILGQTRRAILDSLQFRIGSLMIPTPDWINQLGDPAKSEVVFDEYIDWAISAICYWPGIMYYGTGEGDNNGKSVDPPNFMTLKDVQKPRVEEGAKKLQKLIPNLSLDKLIEVSRLYEKTYTSGKGTKRGLEIEGIADKASIEYKKQKDDDEDEMKL